MADDRTSSEQYHRAELKVALESSHTAHILPPPLPGLERVLDVGCGAGQTLIAAYPGRIAFGIDVDVAALKLGKSLTQDIRFVCGRAEALPWADEQFDMVVARVSLPYSDLDRSLKEIRRVLKKNGGLWMTLHPFAVPWEQVKRANYRGRIYFLYIVLNSVLFHLTGKQFAFLGRYESFQTEDGMQRALKKHGYTAISITRGKHFLVTARAGEWRAD
jgi:ubiquinone/menaquinone biosynthesis C-methylase UbiE